MELARSLEPDLVGAAFAASLPSADFLIVRNGEELSRIELVGGLVSHRDPVGRVTLVDAAVHGDRVALIWLDAGVYILEIYEVRTHRSYYRNTAPGTAVAGSEEGFVILNAPIDGAASFHWMDSSGTLTGETAIELPHYSRGRVLRRQGDAYALIAGDEEGCVHAHWFDGEGVELAERTLYCADEPGCRLSPQWAGRSRDAYVPLTLGHWCAGENVRWEYAVVRGPEDPTPHGRITCSNSPPLVEVDDEALRVFTDRFIDSEFRIVSTLYDFVTLDEISTGFVGPVGRVPNAWFAGSPGRIVSASAHPERDRFLTISELCEP